VNGWSRCQGLLLERVWVFRTREEYDDFVDIRGPDWETLA
jgi:hypothetical protein